MSGTYRGGQNRATGTYDAAVLAMAPVAYWPLRGAGTDATGNGRTATAVGSPTTSTFPNGDVCTLLNGTSQYWEVDDHASLSIITTGRLAIECWIRPDATEFPDTEGTGPYVHLMGKLSASNNEHVGRMYNQYTPDVTPSRSNRISGYVFNAAGGEGAGSHFQEAVIAGQWIHFCVVYDSFLNPGAPHPGQVKVYKNGVLKDTDNFEDYEIVLFDGTAKFRMGTATTASYFKGAMAKCAIYDFAPTAGQLLSHYQLIYPP